MPAPPQSVLAPLLPRTEGLGNPRAAFRTCSRDAVRGCIFSGSFPTEASRWSDKFVRALMPGVLTTDSVVVHPRYS
jgi:hypothetical protein